jgi:hypothetical protein
MWKLVVNAPLAVVGTLMLVSCHTAAKPETTNQTDSNQAISPALKELYMASSAAPPGSQAQQKTILQMAEKASNGRELLLVMRASIGVFPADGKSPEPLTERRLRSIVAAKMMKSAPLDQLIEYARNYSINQEDARPFLERMFQLAGRSLDPSTWYRIKRAALNFRVADLAQQAQARGDRLTGN